MELQTVEQVKEYISSLTNNTELNVERLSGGVSCSVWKVTDDGQRWVLKQALGKLDVEEDWFADVQRIEREQQAMRFLQPLMPVGSVPQIVHSDAGNYLYIMTCAPEEAVPWKSQLMDGVFHFNAARNAGMLLRVMHTSSRNLSTKKQREEFSDMAFFRELRIDPFHQHLMIKYPNLRPEMEALIADLTEHRSCLVHGDFSPKNMLVDEKQQIILLDYEVAHWGNPVFDLAFMLTHLLLKGWVLHKQADALLLMENFLQAYGFNQERDARLVGHTGALLLARIDGKSTVKYLQDEELKQRIRQTAMEWIRNPEQEIITSLTDALKG